MGACKTKQTSPKHAMYYFKEINTSGGDISHNEMSYNVKINISINSITSNEQYKVQLITYSDSQKNVQNKTFETEMASKDNNNTISFNQFFTMTYYFEKQQPLTFNVIKSNSLLSATQTTLGTIMGKRNFTYKNKLNTNEELVITCSELKNSSKVICFDVYLEGIFNNIELVYIIKSMGSIQNPANTSLYRSETKAHPPYQFTQCRIPQNFLAADNNLENSQVNIELIDFKRNLILGNVSNSVSELLQGTKFINLTENRRAVIRAIALEKPPSFIDYLSTGINMKLTIGIDLTCSNGNPNKPGSLHYIYNNNGYNSTPISGNNNMNDYEVAIRYCGDIIASYDPEELFSVFGFGFEFRENNTNNNDVAYSSNNTDNINNANDNTNYSNNISSNNNPNITNGRYNTLNYPINSNLSDPRIYKISGVLETYKNFISKIRLFGPTHFSPIILDLIRVVKEDMNNSAYGNANMPYNKYHILMLLTDGLIGDVQKTKNALVEASFLPISVIIVGMGDANFNSMTMLDADDNPLYDSSGKKADRDIVQFVPFNRFRNNIEKLAEELLEEIPTQVVEYYQRKNILPKNLKR